MSTDNNVLLVQKLIRLTQSKELTWHLTPPPPILTKQKDELIISCYETTYNNSLFYVYAERYKNYSLDFDQWYYTERTMIAALQSDLIVWEYWEQQNLTKELLSVASQQIFDINSFL